MARWEDRHMHRDSDPVGADYRSDRNGGEELDLKVAGIPIKAKGVVTIVVVMFALLIIAVTYSGYRQETATWSIGRLMAEEHRGIRREMDVRTCMDTLDPAEKKWLREHWSQNALNSLCSWVAAPPAQ